MVNKGNKKGAIAEEAMRASFLEKGYFVVRSIPFTVDKFDVTDIDLWLYGISGVFRERINVDIKNKRTPQAIERILWALGVRQALQLTKCIVVTTEKRPAVVNFGRRHGVLVVDSDYLKKEMKYRGASHRLTEEEFLASLCPSDAETKGKELVSRYKEAKKLLLNKLDFDGANLHLLFIGQCLDDMAGLPGMRVSIRRVLFTLMSYLLVTLDFNLSKREFMNVAQQEEVLEAGLKFGNDGSVRIDYFVRQLGQCNSHNDPQFQAYINAITEQIRSDVDDIKADIIAEYITKNLGINALVPLAKLFEAEAFSSHPRSIGDLDTQMKATLLMLVDYCNQDRKEALHW